MVMMTLTVCNPSKQDAFHGRQALGHITSHHITSHHITSHCSVPGTDEASVIRSQPGNLNRAHRPFGCFWHALSPAIVEIVLRSHTFNGSEFFHRRGNELGNAHVTGRMKAVPSRGDMHRRAVAASDERAHRVRHAWRTRRDRRRDFVRPRRARRAVCPRESRPVREHPPIRRPRDTAPSG